MNSQSLDKPAKKILVIGGSTYNPCTPCKIGYALEASNFLEEWAVIFANHKYFYPGSKAHSDKVPHEFYRIRHELINQVKKYLIAQGCMYILPEETDFTIKRQDNGIEIEVVKLNDGSRICINKVMKELAIYQPQMHIAGLIICGRCKDGAEGLKEIKGKGGKTAVQKPDECYHPEIALFDNDTDSMPKAALELHSHQEVSLEYPPRTLTLTEWLCALHKER